MKCLDRLFKNLALPVGESVIEVKNHTQWEKSLPDNVSLLPKTIEQLNIIKPDAFYHFNGIPLILFFENPGDDEIPNIHSQAWCFNQAQLIFILKEDSIHIYNAFRYQKRHFSLHKLDIDESSIKQHFSFWNLQSGNTWQWLEDTFLKKEKKSQDDRVDRYLLKNIRTAVTALVDKGLPPNLANRILLRLIFSRYLIDRGVIIDENYIAGNPLHKKERKNQFNRLISDSSRLYRFFSYLKERFNGNLFEKQENEHLIKQEHLDLLTFFFKGQDLDTGEQVLFDVYDFSIIPIELISGIYEAILTPAKKKKNAAVYTPPFLVDYILTQTVEPYLNANGATQCKVLDPACGSGIFLVEAYRRMVEKEKTNGPVPDGKLVELLENNIYGIEKDESALNVAIFSLYIALLDYKAPKDIKQIKLPKLLNVTLFTADFFDTGHRFNDVVKHAGITFILGNPPWKSDKSPLHIQYTANYPIDDYQMAQSFLIRSKDFSAKTTVCALLVTSSVLHKAKKFSPYFLKHYALESVLDLSTVRRRIFNDADNPAVVIIYRFTGKPVPAAHQIKHMAVRSNMFLTHFNALVIESQNIITLNQELAIKYPWMWKVALYGNALDFYLMQRLYSIPQKTGEFVARFPGIYAGNGILTGKPKHEPFTFLQDLPLVESGNITHYYTAVNDATPRLKKGDTYLEKGRRPELFQGEQLLLKRRTINETEIPVSYTDSPCVFRNSAYAFSSQKHPNILKELYGLFISNLFAYYQFLGSANWGVYYPEININEYLAFPYSEIEDRESFATLVDQFICYYKKYYSNPLKSENIPLPGVYHLINQAVNRAYEIDDAEKDIIDYALNVSRYLFQENKLREKVLKPVTDDDLEHYARIYYEYFSHLYNTPGEHFQVEYFHLDYFVAMKFTIVADKPAQEEQIVKSTETDPHKIMFQVLAQRTSLYNITGDLYLNKVVKGFEEDFFYIVKPNQYMSWHRATAHADLAEFINDIDKAEFELMKEQKIA